VGQAAGPRLWSGDAHLSVGPPGYTPDHCRHHPGVGDHAYLAASPTGVCATTHSPGPLAPRDIHLRLGPRPGVWSRQRRARSSTVSRPCAPWPSLGRPPPSLPQPAVPRPASEGTPVASASPILNGMSSPRGAILRAAPAGCRGALGARAAGGASGGHRRARGACDRGGAARKGRLFYLSTFGFLANRGRQEKLAQCRVLLGQATRLHTREEPVAREMPAMPASEPGTQCPICEHGRMQLVKTLYRQRAAWDLSVPAPGLDTS